MIEDPTSQPAHKPALSEAGNETLQHLVQARMVEATQAEIARSCGLAIQTIAGYAQGRLKSCMARNIPALAAALRVDRQRLVAALRREALKNLDVH